MSIDEKNKKSLDILSIIDDINTDAEMKMESIDWDKNAADITRNVKINNFNKFNKKRSYNFTLRTSMLMVASVLLVGISLGYFLTNRNIREANTYIPEKGARITMARLESTLNRREITLYFEQAHMLITEIMEVCKDHTITTDSKYITTRRVKNLLKKNRLFNKDSSDPKWLVSQNLLKKIEWILLEILMSDGELSCEKQKKLQEYISKERLLFKLRLLSSEASFSEV